MKKTITVGLILSILFACSCASKPEQTQTVTETEKVTEVQTVTETEAETTAETEEVKPVRTFKNPISDKSMPDPFIVYHDGYYYGLATEVPTVTLYRSRTVEDLFISGESKVLIKCGDDVGGGKTLGWNEWAPEIHYNPKENKWYVYSCACMNGFEFDSMRMYCLESEGDDPFGDYKFKGVTLPDALCIDQTVYYDEDSGELYTAYCSFTGDRGQVIMIADMKTPWQVGDTRTMITYPKYTWEKRGSDGTNDGRVNEGPIFFKHGGQIYLIYSASGCWSQYYCLGMLKYTGQDTTKENFLKRSNWEKSDKPIFEKANNVYAPGHCSFFTSPDGSEIWIAYHGMATKDAGVEGRFAYIQKIDFDENGAPVLGKPLPRETDIPVPSGQ